jgi:hypothetical protein
LMSKVSGGVVQMSLMKSQVIASKMLYDKNYFICCETLF